MDSDENLSFTGPFFGLTGPEVDVYLKDMALKCILDLNEEERRQGFEYSPEARSIILETRGLKATLDWIRELKAAQTSPEEEPTVFEVVEEAEPEPCDPLSLWRRHPFLVGWFGADILNKLRR